MPYFQKVLKVEQGRRNCGVILHHSNQGWHYWLGRIGEVVSLCWVSGVASFDVFSAFSKTSMCLNLFVWKWIAEYNTQQSLIIVTCMFREGS